MSQAPRSERLHGRSSYRDEMVGIALLVFFICNQFAIALENRIRSERGRANLFICKKMNE